MVFEQNYTLVSLFLHLMFVIFLGFFSDFMLLNHFLILTRNNSIYVHYNQSYDTYSGLA